MKPSTSEESREPDEPADERVPESAEAVASGAPSDPGLLDFARESPLATAALALSIVAGAIIGYAFIGEELSLTRRILGGALAGGGSWLLVMFGRVI